MKVNIQVQCGTKPLDQRYRARAGCLFRIACLLDQMGGDDAIDYPEHLARDHRTAGEEKTQQEWKAEHPLAHRLMGKNLIYQKGCALGHAPCPTARAESTPFATKSD